MIIIHRLIFQTFHSFPLSTSFSLPPPKKALKIVFSLLFFSHRSPLRKEKEAEMRLLPVLLFLLWIWAVGSGTRDPEPFDHGLAHEHPAAEASPAMRAFFLNGSAASSSLPEVAANRNATGNPIWDLVGRPVPRHELAGKGGERARRRRAALLATGITCAAAGLGLLAAAVAAYVVQRRRRRGEAVAPPPPWGELRRVPEVL